MLRRTQLNSLATFPQGSNTTMKPAPSVVFLRNRRHFGAQILTLPVLYALKEIFPKSPLWIISRAEVKHIYGQIAWIDRLILSTSTLNDCIVMPKNAAAVVSLRPSSLAPPFLSYIKRAECSIGYARHPWLLNKINQVGITFDGSRFRAIHYLELLKTIKPNLNIDEALAAPFKAQAKLAPAAPADNGEHFNLVLIPGAGGGEFKKWGITNFLKLADSLASRVRGKMRAYIVLGPAEHEEKMVLERQQRDSLQLLTDPSLAELCTFIQRADLVVSNDCGPSHIAQCLGAPYVGIYDCYKPEWYWPRAGSISVSADNLNNDIKQISVNSVLSACLSVIEEPQRTHAPLLPRLDE